METILRPDAALSSALVGMVHHLGYPTVSNRIIPGLNGGGHAARLKRRSNMDIQLFTDIFVIQAFRYGVCDLAFNIKDKLSRD